jgi:hypothetical protein
MLLYTASWAGEITSDKLQFSSETLVPGETKTQYVNLTLLGSRLYSGYNVKITIPEGVELAYEYDELDLQKGDAMLRISHTVAGEYNATTRILKVICSSSINAEFKQTSGVVCRIGLVVSTYAKPGALSLALSDQALTTAATVEYDPADVTDENVTIGTTAKASLSVSSANKWSTCILPFATALPGGLKAYTISSKDDDKGVFYLANVSSIEAYTPYMLYSESGYTGTLTGEVNASQYPEDGKVAQGYLTGALEKQTTNEGYVLQNKGDGVKFYLMDSGQSYTIPAGKCWATPAASTTQSYNFEFPTAVKGIAEVAESKNESKYNLSGIMIDEPKSGQLYIQNGKKYVK